MVFVDGHLMIVGGKGFVDHLYLYMSAEPSGNATDDILLAAQSHHYRKDTCNGQYTSFLIRQ